MGQYYKIVNIDKKEYFSPNIFNDNDKLGGIMNGVHPYVLSRLLLSNFDSKKEPIEFGNGYWAGDRIVISGDESGCDFFGLKEEIENEDYIIFNDLVVDKFKNIGKYLLFNFINDDNFQELILQQLENDKYFIQISLLVFQSPNETESLKSFLDLKFGNNWIKKAKKVWEENPNTFI